jgi:hypothetical protein
LILQFAPHLHHSKQKAPRIFTNSEVLTISKTTPFGVISGTKIQNIFE